MPSTRSAPMSDDEKSLPEETEQTASDTTETDEVHRFITVAGSALIQSGASSASTTSALQAVCDTAGLKGVTVSVTLGQLILSEHGHGTGTPHTRVFEFPAGSLDIWWRSRAEEVLERYFMGELTPAEATEELTTQIEAKPTGHLWRTLLGYALLGAGFSQVLGGDAIITIGAAAISCLVSYVFRLLAKTHAPGIFSYALGGFVAALAATAFSPFVTGSEVTICIVSALAAKLAGMASYGAVQDAITGWYLSATGRLIDGLTCTAGLVAGVSSGVALAQLLDPNLKFVDAVSPAPETWALSVAGAALVAAGFAMSSGSTFLRTAVMATLGAGAQLISSGLEISMAAYPATGLTAAAVGAASVLAARPLNLSSNAIMTVALLPLFPGMLVYQGLLGSVFNVDGSGKTLLEASVTAFCLALGGILGQFLVTDLLWKLRKKQFQRNHPDQDFESESIDENHPRDIMLPVFRRPKGTY
ncbi:threonine/serine ThrE exporter family protein [Arthrobacter sp. UM1]|uniref:threonine/serine ThrE exporter family protein n=1 Tax=Arthrobacter sp. UM1 TaxID=2766776 RepID=UPI001CF70A86|nr:threonine/serine exporter family protein [Arthrobacter sp. UM1]MCB4208007.1 threonine/serine exporter family protein [Arthrobacter sp. UM1]